MAIKYLLPENGNFYKANLHAHSNLSDGRLSPAEMKAAYKERGYSVLCITDHELLINHADLNDPDFLMLTGYELSVTEPADPRGWPFTKTCHMNFYSPRQEYTKYVCFSPDHYNDHMRESLNEADIPEETYKRTYTPECITEMVRMAHEAGFLCSYNHPDWSLETDAQYLKYKGFDMMELHNHGCAVVGLDEDNAWVYDQMLRAGRRLAASATDDNHNGLPIDHPQTGSFGGYVWIKAPSLDYEDIWNALRYGDFYACTGGPEIESLTLEDGVVTLKCAPARQISMQTARRIAPSVRGTDDAPVTEFSYELTGEEEYIRFTVTGTDGHRSQTRAYFIDELGL